MTHISKFIPHTCDHDGKSYHTVFAQGVSPITPATFNSLDAKAIARDNLNSTVYSTPTMIFIPKPHNDEEELCVQADGHFGTADCFQWPQLYCHKYRYAICIRRQEHYMAPDPLSWVWYHPTSKDFEPLTHAAFQVGKLKQEKAVGIASLLQIASDRYKEWKDMCGDKQDIASGMLQSLKHDIMLLLRLSTPNISTTDLVVFLLSLSYQINL